MTAELVELSGRELAPVATPDTDSWTEVVGFVAKLAGQIADTEFVPRGLRGSAAAVTAAILYGREVGLPPMTALTQVYVLDGRPAMYAEGMRALVLAGGHDLEVRNATGATCTVAGRRRGSGRWQEVTWNMDMARAANLVRPKSNWETHPRAMLVARATTELCRQLFPDVIHGFRSVEEVEDEPPGDTPEPPTRQRVTVQRAGAAATPEAPTAAPPSPTTAGRRGGGTTTRRTRRTTEPPAGRQSTPRDAPAGPPLPGEPGYRDLAALPPTGSPETPAGVEEPSAPPDGDQPGESLDPPDGGAEAPEDFPHGGSKNVRSAPEDPPAGDTSPEVVKDPDAPARRVDLVRLRLDFERLGVTNRDHRIAYLCAFLGRDIATSVELTRRETHQLIETLALCQTRDDLERVAGATEAHRAEAEQAALIDPP